MKKKENEEKENHDNKKFKVGKELQIEQWKRMTIRSSEDGQRSQKKNKRRLNEQRKRMKLRISEDGLKKSKWEKKKNFGRVRLRLKIKIIKK